MFQQIPQTDLVRLRTTTNGVRRAWKLHWFDLTKGLCASKDGRTASLRIYAFALCAIIRVPMYTLDPSVFCCDSSLRNDVKVVSDHQCTLSVARVHVPRNDYCTQK